MKSQIHKTEQQILDALGLQNQQVMSLNIEMKPGSLIVVTAEMGLDEEQTRRLGEAVAAELQRYELTPIKDEEV